MFLRMPVGRAGTGVNAKAMSASSSHVVCIRIFDTYVVLTQILIKCVFVEEQKVIVSIIFHIITVVFVLH
jgi:hypothetical protein